MGKLKATIVTQTKNEGEKKTTVKQDLEILPCSQIQHLLTELDSSISDKGYYCVAPNIEIKGNTNDLKTKKSFSFSSLEIQFVLCEQEGEDNDCMTSQEIDDYF